MLLLLSSQNHHYVCVSSTPTCGLCYSCMLSYFMRFGIISVTAASCFLTLTNNPFSIHRAPSFAAQNQFRKKKSAPFMSKLLWWLRHRGKFVPKSYHMVGGKYISLQTSSNRIDPVPDYDTAYKTSSPRRHGLREAAVRGYEERITPTAHTPHTHSTVDREVRPHEAHTLETAGDRGAYTPWTSSCIETDNWGLCGTHRVPRLLVRSQTAVSRRKKKKLSPNSSRAYALLLSMGRIKHEYYRVFIYLVPQFLRSGLGLGVRVRLKPHIIHWLRPETQARFPNSPQTTI